ncbi:MAG: molybdopterin-dependent oxidoreductase, partial [Pseudomonadota bacterium]
MSGEAAADAAREGVATTCPYCGVGCGLRAAADGRGGAAVAGDPEHPANFGRLCSKGSALGETLDLEGRLLAPRIGGAEASWDDALGLVASTFSEAVAEHGPDSVAFYVSGQLLTEDYYVANKLMKGFIGSANIDTNSRLCMASSVAGHVRAFGADTVPGTYEDLEAADLIVLVGSNLAWCHPVLQQRIAAAKAARPGLKVINIDPRETATSAFADGALRLAPGSDVALFAGLLLRIEEEGAIDAAYVGAHVSGAAEAFRAARDMTIDRVARITGLSPVEIADFYALWLRTEKVVTIYSQGVNQSSAGTDKVSAIINCHLASGRIGREGMGPFSVTGQPNAMGGREVGGLATMLAAHLDIADPEHRAAVRAFWRAPTICERPGLKAVDMFRACADGRIKALWIMSTNPAVSLPEADGVAASIRACPFVAVSDIIADTDTARLADVALPAAGWGEKDGTVTNSERRISRQRAFLRPPGAARPDWRIIADVAARMGWPEAFDYDGPAAIFREHAALSAVAGSLGRDFDIGAAADISDDAYAALAPFQWPAPRGGAEGGRFFATGGFFTPDGRARMIPTRHRAPARPTTRAHPLRLNTGRVRDHWHTMTRTAKSA